MTAIIDQQRQNALQAAEAFDRASGFSQSRAAALRPKDVHRWLASFYADYARLFPKPSKPNPNQ